NTRLQEECIDGRFGARERGGVRACGTCSRAAAPALHREDRLLLRDAAREPSELAGVAERLEVQEHELRRGIVLPVLEQVVRRDVGLVADRDEGRKPDAT